MVQDPSEAVVVVGDVAGEDLCHPGEQPLDVVGERVPRTDRVEQRPRLAVRAGALRLAVRVDRRELRALRQESERDLALEDASADGLVALVEGPLVPVRPLQRHEVRSVPRLRRQIHEERLVGVDDLGVLDELDGLVRHVVGEVVAVLRTPGGLDRVVVVHEVREPRVRLAAQPPVEALEATAERPAALVRRQVALLARGEVPLADAVGVVARARRAPRRESRSRTGSESRSPGTPTRTRRWWPSRSWSRCGPSAVTPGWVSRARSCGSSRTSTPRSAMRRMFGQSTGPPKVSMVA